MLNVLARRNKPNALLQGARWRACSQNVRPQASQSGVKVRGFNVQSLDLEFKVIDGDFRISGKDLKELFAAVHLVRVL